MVYLKYENSKVRIDPEKDVAYLKTPTGESKLPNGSTITANATLEKNYITKEEYEK